MLLSALDVPDEAIVCDYLDSGRCYSTQRLLVQMQNLAGRPLEPRLADAIAELAQVKASYLDAALGEVARGWGSVPAYLVQEAGLDEAMRIRLHGRLLG